MSIITTKRLILSPYIESDRQDYIDLVTDPDVMLHIEEGVATTEAAEDWWHRLVNGLYESGIRWSARTLDDSRYVGHAMINHSRPGNACELGYLLPKIEWGKGYATEMAQAIADYSRDSMGLKEIFATVDEGFEQSLNVLTKLGMKFHGYDFDDKGRYLVYVLKHAQDTNHTELNPK